MIFLYIQNITDMYTTPCHFLIFFGISFFDTTFQCHPPHSNTCLLKSPDARHHIPLNQTISTPDSHLSHHFIHMSPDYFWQDPKPQIIIRKIKQYLATCPRPIGFLPSLRSRFVES